jgi:hypothetical protein
VLVAMLACALRVRVAIPRARCGCWWRSRVRAAGAGRDTRVRAAGAGGDPKDASRVQVAMLAFASRVQVAIQTGTQHRK